MLIRTTNFICGLPIVKGSTKWNAFAFPLQTETFHLEALQWSAYSMCMYLYRQSITISYYEFVSLGIYRGIKIEWHWGLQWCTVSARVASCAWNVWKKEKSLIAVDSDDMENNVQGTDVFRLVCFAA